MKISLLWTVGIAWLAILVCHTEVIAADNDAGKVDGDSATTPASPSAPAAPAIESVDDYETEGGGEKFSILYADAPDLQEWTRKVLAPAVAKWYPMIVRMLPSPEFEAPRKFTIEFTNKYHGVAATGGTHIMCDPSWYRKNIIPKGQGPGSVVHELVHVVQQYGRARRANPGFRPPGWLVEGIPDYIRWYLYEPEAHGADITERNFSRAKYDGMYRISANFLNWATAKYDPDLVPKLNTALRDGSYQDVLWEKLTQRTLQQLNDDWRQSLADKLGIVIAPAPEAVGNKPGAEEKAAAKETTPGA